MEDAVSSAIPKFALQRVHVTPHAWRSLFNCRLLSLGFALHLQAGPLLPQQHSTTESELNTDF